MELDIWQLGSAFKQTLHIRQSKIILIILISTEKLVSPVILKTLNIYLEMSTWSSNFNHNFGFVAEEIFEQGILENLDRCFNSFKKIVL